MSDTTDIEAPALQPRFRWMSRIPMSWTLSASMGLCLAPAVAAATRGLQSADVVTLMPSIMLAIFILLSWKPMVAYTELCQRANSDCEKSAQALRRAMTLRDRMVAEVEALEGCPPSEREIRSVNARSTYEELERVMERLEPLHAQSTETLAQAQLLGDALPHRRAVAWMRRGLVQGLTGLAVVVAGDRGARLRDTWQADLVGAPEDGLAMGRWQQVWHATGFVAAAVRMRGRVLAEPAWKPIDWLLATESRTRTATALAVGAQVIVIDVKSGAYVLITEGWGWCAGCAVAVHFLFRWLRGVRGIELATVERSERD